MIKLDNPFLKAVALTVAVVFSFTSIAQAGDGQLLKSIPASDDEVVETLVGVTESINVEGEVQDADSALLQFNFIAETENAISGLITPAPISSLELASLSKIDEQWSSYTNAIIAGDGEAMNTALVILTLAALALMIYGLYLVYEAHKDNPDTDP